MDDDDEGEGPGKSNFVLQMQIFYFQTLKHMGCRDSALLFALSADGSSFNLLKIPSPPLRSLKALKYVIDEVRALER